MKSQRAIYCLWIRRTKHGVSNCLRGFSDTIMIHLSPSKSHIVWFTECIKHLDHIETSFRSQLFEVIAKQNTCRAQAHLNFPVIVYWIMFMWLWSVVNVYFEIFWQRRIKKPILVFLRTFCLSNLYFNHSSILSNHFILIQVVMDPETGPI